MATERISVLLVGEANSSCNEIERLLRHTHWRVYRTESVAETCALLARVSVDVVLCERDLRDGGWKDILKTLDYCDSIASVIVLSDADERIWGEVLNMGGYDLLPLPCDASELYAIIPAAWRHCMNRRQNQPVAAGMGCGG